MYYGTFENFDLCSIQVRSGGSSATPAFKYQLNIVIKLLIFYDFQKLAIEAEVNYVSEPDPFFHVLT